MKLPCEIIKDLLPLYAEELASPGSRDAVEEHVGECADCRKALAELRQETAVPVQTSTDALAHLERKLRRRRIDAAILAILATASVLFGMIMYLYAPVYLSVEEAVVSVTDHGDIVTVEMSPRAEYCRWEDSVDPDTGRKSITMIAARHRWNVLLEEIVGPGRSDTKKKNLSAGRDIWYAAADSGEEDILLWGVEPSGGRISLPRLVMGYYFWMALAGGMILAVPAVLLRKKQAGKVLAVGAVMCMSFALSDLIATGGNWRIYDGYDVPVLLTFMVIQTALLTGSVVLAFRTWRTNEAH